MFIFIVGSIGNGFSFVGPFDSHEHATRYAESFDGPEYWEIAEVFQPENEDFDFLSEEDED